MFLYEQYTSFLQDQRPLLQTGWLRFLLNGLQLFIEATHSNNTSLSLSVEPDSVCVCVSVCVWRGRGGCLRRNLQRSDQLLQTFGRHRLGTFQWKTESTIPDEGSHNAKSTGHAKQNSVVLHFLQAIVLFEGKHSRLNWFKNNKESCLPEAKLQSEHQHWAMGSWPCPTPTILVEQPCRFELPVWREDRLASVWEQTLVDKCNGDQSCEERRVHNRERPRES